MDVQKLTLAILPFFFYFVPNILIKDFYKKYVKEAYYKFAKESEDEFYDVKELDNKFSRIISFVAFLSIVATTIFTLLFSKGFQSNFIFNCYCFSISIAFLFASFWNIIVNFKKKLSLSSIEEYFEIGIVALSSALIYFYS